MSGTIGGKTVDFLLCLNEDSSPLVRSYDITGSSVTVAAGFKLDIIEGNNFLGLVVDLFNTVTGHPVALDSTAIESLENAEGVIYFIAIPYHSRNLPPAQKVKFASALTTIVEEVQKKTDGGLDANVVIKDMWTMRRINAFQLESEIMVTTIRGTKIDFSLCLSEDRSPSVRSYDSIGSSDTVVAGAFEYDLIGGQSFRTLVHDIFNKVTRQGKPNTSSTIEALEVSSKCIVYFISLPYPSADLTPTQKDDFVSALTTIVEEVQKKTDAGLIRDMWDIRDNSFQLESTISILPTPPTASNIGNMNFGSLSGLSGPTGVQKVTDDDFVKDDFSPTPSAPVPNSSVDSPEISVLLETVHTAIFDTNTTIINTYFDTGGSNGRIPKMVQFAYGGRDIKVPLIVLNPPNLFGLAEITIGPAGREYRFRKDTNTSHMFNTMFQPLQ